MTDADDSVSTTFLIVRDEDGNAYLMPAAVLDQWRVPDDKRSMLEGLAEITDVRGFATAEQIRDIAEFLQAVMEAKSDTMQATMQMLGSRAILQANVRELSLVR
jgi:hypothetical protein